MNSIGCMYHSIKLLNSIFPVQAQAFVLIKHSKSKESVPMAFRASVRPLLCAARGPEPLLGGEGGLRGFVERLKQRLSTGKFVRPDVQDDYLRKPVDEESFRFPSPGYVIQRSHLRTYIQCSSQ